MRDLNIYKYLDFYYRYLIFIISIKNALRYAIRMGYRHIDCAMIYQNEHEVGEVFGEMLDKEVPRSEFFIVGKVKP